MKIRAISAQDKPREFVKTFDASLPRVLERGFVGKILNQNARGLMEEKIFVRLAQSTQHNSLNMFQTTELFDKILSEFVVLCKIPRGSKNYHGIHQYLTYYCNLVQSEIKIDSAGNVGILLNPPFDEKRHSLLLQSHMDMVTIKDEGIEHDFEKDAITFEIQGDFMVGKGTTLGADNGIGLAASLVIGKMVQKQSLFNLYLLITADEEIGMLGAQNMRFDSFLPQKALLLNLDCESSRRICVGSAGTCLTQVTWEKKTREEVKLSTVISIVIKGLHGGHSGVTIHHPHGNAIKLTALLLKGIQDKFGISEILCINGGEAENAIPVKAKVQLILPTHTSFEDIKNYCRSRQEQWSRDFSEPALSILVETKELESELELQQHSLVPFDVIDFLLLAHQGVITNFNSNCVATSSNLSLIHTADSNIILTILSRSMFQTAMKDYYDYSLVPLANKTNGKLSPFKSSSSWCADLKKSQLYQILQQTHQEQFRQEAECFTVHAGLETVTLQEHYPQWDILSIGPNINGAHTTKESLELSSVTDFGNWLQKICCSSSLK